MKFIKDEEFIRGNCPMTKEEIRMLSICKMEIEEDSVIVDVGSGTGSITVQAGIMCPKGKVISIEKEEKAYEITKKNIEKFNLDNIKLIKDEGSLCLERLINENFKCNCVFIGGSSGHLEEILKKCDQIIKKDGKIVMNFITLDNTYKAAEMLKSMNYDIDISLANISKNRGNSFMMMALNPIYIIKGRKLSGCLINNGGI